MISRLNALASVGFISATIESSGVEYQLTDKGKDAGRCMRILLRRTAYQ